MHSVIVSPSWFIQINLMTVVNCLLVYERYTTNHMYAVYVFPTNKIHYNNRPLLCGWPMLHSLIYIIDLHVYIDRYVHIDIAPHWQIVTGECYGPMVVLMFTEAMYICSFTENCLHVLNGNIYTCIWLFRWMKRHTLYIISFQDLIHTCTCIHMCFLILINDEYI